MESREKNAFFEWINKNSDYSNTSISACKNAIKNVAKLAEANGLGDIFNWNNKEWIFNEDKLRNLKEFTDNNKSTTDDKSKGSGWFSASLSKLKNFKMKNLPLVIPPVIPFPEFKWRWAVTTPTEGLNTEELLFGVLSILVKHDGKKHATQEFKDDLLELEKSSGTKIGLAKIDRDLNKNIIENSGQYWKALGLLNSTTDGTISVTDLGKGIINGTISKVDFIKKLYNEFSLPNLNIENQPTINIWKANNVQVLPIKIIFDILLGLTKHIQSPAEWYIDPNELKNVIVPLSIYNDLDIEVYIQNILEYRKDNSKFSSWPNCAPGDNDFRMIKEYLLFLSNFGFLDFVELSNKSKRFYINSSTLLVLDDSISLDKEDILPEKFIGPDFNYKHYIKSLTDSKLNFSELLIVRFLASLTSKPFVILSGLSGSGKTKIAQSFAQWICESESQYKIVPVGADWTNREPLVGYPNGLVAEEYITPDSGVIHLLLEATTAGNENKPFFLILDEMNLSHVERYFADFLSIMESNDKMKLYTGEKRKSIDGKDIPLEMGWPKNVFIIGTVNIDETTYMFSPKVLDRANVIEFRITEDEIKTYLANPGVPDLKKLEREGISMAESFLKISEDDDLEKNEDLSKELVLFFNQLKSVGAEFGYRSATEILQLVSKLKMLEPSLQVKDNDCLDIAIMQKLLPKLHGSRSKLVKILVALGEICLVDSKDAQAKYFDSAKLENYSEDDNVKYPISFEKLTRMYKNVLANGFTSYAEA